MKKVLLFVSLFTFGAGFAQDCSKIFISEYVEGWSNNKALEIYNPTNATVDLSAYVVARASNGSSIGAVTVANAVQLSGTVAPHSVFVAVLDKRDPNGTGQEAPIWDSLQVRADGFFAPNYNTSNSFYWNGNDAVILFQGSIAGQAGTTTLTSITPALTIVDIFGKVGEDPGPGTGWSTSFPYNNNMGTVVTIDHSMIRKSTVKKGVTNLNISFFDPMLEYDTIPAVTYLFDENGDTLVSGNGNAILFGNWFTLGGHACECGDAAVNEIAKEVKAAFAVYPNPSTNGVFTVEAASGVEAITIFNSLGQVVKNQKFNATEANVRITDLPGVYIMKVQTGDGIVSKRVIVK
ncbi:MAG: hypothetical protein K0R65_3024 [Crocinitomicaceae bacterium]|jgi:hypothetical protein|nr:hypothetical protein [Crocinitomicaceae bacterium]